MGNLIRAVAFTLVFIVFVCSCNPNEQSPQGEDLKSLTLTKELDISADETDALIGDLSGLAVDDNGNIYAADTRRERIHVFSSDGQYLDSLGREGKGPGEFIDLDPQIRILSDTLYTKDNRLNRISLFNLQTRESAGTIAIPDAEIDGVSMGFAREIFPLKTGNLLVSFVNPYRSASAELNPPHMTTFSLLDKTGAFVEKNLFQIPTSFPTNQKLAYTKGGGIVVYSGLTFYPETKMALGPDEHLYVGKSDSLSIRAYNKEGVPVDTIRGQYTPSSLTDADMDSLYNSYNRMLQKVVEEAGRPQNWPAFEKFFVDDNGRCWVELGKPGTSQEWRVFNKDGKAEWKFSLPPDISLHEVQNGKAYGISNPDGGISSVIRYSIDPMN